MHVNLKAGAGALCLGLLVAGAAPRPAWAAGDLIAAVATRPAARSSPAVQADRPKHADFERESASEAARKLADWVIDSNNNRQLPFIILDKVEAKVFVFHGNGRLRGAAPALLGLAVGDDSVPGIGERKLSTITPQERTTPAGRFVAALDRNLKGKQMLWVDYESAISLHPVITSNAVERRAERLSTPTPLDNRISYGCINVPAPFFSHVVTPAFSGTNGIVYVMPEVKSPQAVFGSYEVAGNAGRQSARQ